MGFEVLQGVEVKNEAISKIKLILQLIGIESDDLNESTAISMGLIEEGSHRHDLFKLFLNKLKEKTYPITSYTPKRLEVAIAKFRKDNNKSDLLLELLSRLYYDTCNQGEYLVFEYPPLLQIEISSKCNYKCVFCYQTDKSFSDPTSEYMGFMDLKLFKKVIDEIEGNIPYITFASRGEPTLHPDFIEILSYCKGKFYDIKINTNASAQNKAKVQAILDVCHTVVFSIDTPDPDNYPEIRVGGNLDHVIRNIK